jgi:hypothetical protein
MQAHLLASFGPDRTLALALCALVALMLAASICLVRDILTFAEDADEAVARVGGVRHEFEREQR